MEAEKIYCTDGGDKALAYAAKAEQALSEATRHKQVLDKANTLLADISPEMKREQETETRMQAMEDTLREMQKTLSTLVSELK